MCNGLLRGVLNGLEYFRIKNWWSWGESNSRPESVNHWHYMLSLSLFSALGCGQTRYLMTYLN